MSQTDRDDPSAVIVDTTASPLAQLQPVPLTAVTLLDRFWEPRRETNRRATLPSQYEHCEQTGRIDNFRRAAGQIDGPFQGIYFNDSDVYKWLEGVAWTLATHPDATLVELADRVIDAIAGAQQQDGYLGTYFMFEHESERWSDPDKHEMYCAGHLFQAAIAHQRATGSRRLLDVATRFADHICATFGPEEQGKKAASDGHPEVEMALVELYRATGERRYLDQAQFLLDVRGRGLASGHRHFNAAYFQDHKPFREFDEMIGHAVRAVYLNAGATDLYAETGEGALKESLDRQWQNMTARKMYVSGGLGSRYEGEAFGKEYELPNERAYTETCAAIGGVMWNWRMLALGGDARYADSMEQMLYNAVLPGLSLDGQSYFYQNPLADDGTHRRRPWFTVACCPPNLSRFLPSLPGYFYSVSDETVWVHLYGENDARITLPDGREVMLSQRTDYPWDGRVSLRVEGTGTFALKLRIPGWCEGAALTVNGVPWATVPEGGTYLEVRRSWESGDILVLTLPMAVRRVACHPHVAENWGRVALMRGPLLYCVEGVDHPGIDLRDLVVPADAEFVPLFEEGLLGGVVVLRGRASLNTPSASWANTLYRSRGAGESDGSSQETALTAVPYYAWANREAGQMRVWIREG